MGTRLWVMLLPFTTGEPPMSTSAILENREALTAERTLPARTASSAPQFTHATDDLGFPICSCARCAERSRVLNAAYVARLIGNHWSGLDLDKQKEIARGDDMDVTPQQHGCGR